MGEVFHTPQICINTECMEFCSWLIAILMEVINIEELKSCPFCGGKAEIIMAKRPIGAWFVSCKDCKSATDTFENDKYVADKEV